MKKILSLYFKDFSLAHTNDLIFWSDLEGKLVYANQVVADMLGYQVAELYDKYAWDIIKGKGQKGWAAQKQLLIHKQYFSLTATYLQTDGTPYPTQTNLYYIQEGDGYICAIAKYKEPSIDENPIEHFTHQTVNQIQDIIIWSKPDGELVYFNDAVTTQLGYTRAEFAHIKPSELVLNYDVSEQREFRNTLKTKNEFVGECLLKRKNGTHLPAEINTTTVFYAGETLNCTIFRDISLRREAEATLLKQQVEFKNIIHNTTDAIITADKQGNILLWNRGAEVMFGWTYDEMYQQPIEIIMPEQFHQAHQQGMNRYMETGQPRVIGKTVELVGKRKDETDFPISISLAHWKDEEEHYFCGIIRDVSQQKAREEELKTLLQENLKLKSALEVENAYLQEEMGTSYNFGEIITQNKAYKKILSQIKGVAKTETIVLITGETGTGKELIARAIHQSSNRSSFPLIKVNCARLSEKSMEQELFGMEKNNSSSDRIIKKGVFERANGATILLEEVGELPLKIQAKLLSVLESQTFIRSGGKNTLTTDVRLIITSNKDLLESVKAGAFREDLYYQINVFPINNLPLRSRKDDIPLLIKHLLKKISQRLDKKVFRISKRTLQKLMDYDFPGNVRELENIIERAVILSDSETLKITEPLTLKKQNKPDEEKILSHSQMERHHILKILKMTNGKISGSNGAAQLLQLNPNTLTSKMKKLNISKKDYMG